MEFQYYLPVNLVFGRGSVAKIGNIAVDYGKKALIVTGHSSTKKSGLLDRIIRYLEKSGIESVVFDKVKQNLRQLAVTLTGRLVIVPLILVPIAAIMGFRGVELLSVFIMAGAPTAVSSFTMAEQMEADGELAGQIVVFGSTFCIITIFLWIFCLKQIGLI